MTARRLAAGSARDQPVRGASLIAGWLTRCGHDATGYAARDQRPSSRCPGRLNVGAQLGIGTRATRPRSPSICARTTQAIFCSEVDMCGQLHVANLFGSRVTGSIPQLLPLLNYNPWEEWIGA